MSILELKSVSKSYGPSSGSAETSHEVLSDVNLSIREGEFVAIVGFSGSGKTTLIATIAGLIPPDSGEVLFKGQRVTEPGPDRGVVFQNYSLLPWLTVQSNVALAVDSVFPKWSKEQRQAHVRKYIEMVGLSHASERRPAELSGGMRQRVAVARALAMDPEILLLDEPLSALDALTRARLQDEIEAIWERQRKTVILVTNDVDEALLLADRIIALEPGPRATLGREFKVDMPRPRDRLSVNQNDTYRRLRAQISQYLMGLGSQRNASAPATKALPDVVPIGTPEPRSLRRALRPKPAENLDKFVEFYDVTK